MSQVQEESIIQMQPIVIPSQFQMKSFVRLNLASHLCYVFRLLFVIKLQKNVIFVMNLIVEHRKFYDVVF